MKQAALFIFAGGAAAGVNVGSRLLYSLTLPLPAATVLAYITGMVAAYLKIRRLVFESARDRVRQRAGRSVVKKLLACRRR